MYAILSAIEEDLRDAIVTHIAGKVGDEDALGAELFSRASERLRRDEDFVADSLTLETVLPYTDFGDLIQVVARHRALLGTELGSALKVAHPLLEKLVPIRNRVMHSRPLNFDDLARVTDAAESFSQSNVARQQWRTLQATMQAIAADPSTVLKLEIPVTSGDEGVYHNLPTPDFDETGFIGRTQTVEQVINACLGAFPVVTIVGEGGVGKTALAIKCAYEILDREDSSFEAVVFTSAKTTQLNAQEIRRIENAISTSVGMIESIADTIAGESADPFADVLAQLRDFRVLLILDNLETVLDENLRSFLGSLPRGSKVLITSRIGVGAYEYPVKLTPLADDEAVQLLRAVARARNVAELTRTSQKNLVPYCRRMRNNPLHIKWFVSAVQSGKRPEEVLANDALFLDFCMSNVYDYLAAESRTVLRGLLAVGGRYTLAELAFITDLDDLTLQRAVQQLLTTNMLVMSSVPSGSSFETRYELAPLARSYLAKRYPASAQEHQRFTRAKQQLVSAAEEIRAGVTHSPNSAYSVQTRSRSDWVVAKYLLDALEKSRKKDYPAAEALVVRARNLAPAYYEVYRVDAWIKSQQGNLMEAQTSYEAAIDLEANSVALRLLYGGFLLRELQEIDAAIVQYEEAARIDPDSADVQLELARGYVFTHQYERALSALQRLAARSDLAEKLRRKIDDLQLQYYERLADHHANQQEPFACIDALVGLRSGFERIQMPDSRMRERLRKAIPTARACLRLLHDVAAEDQVLELLKWLSEEGGRSRAEVEVHIGERLTGVVQELPLHENYGFVRAANGRTLFFHRNQLAVPEEWPRLFLGQPVRFEIGENVSGICAVGVKIDTTARGAELPIRGAQMDGEIVRLREEAGFGFVRADSGPEFFFHRSVVHPPSDWFELGAGDRVSFVVGVDARNRRQADKLWRAGQAAAEWTDAS